MHYQTWGSNRRAGDWPVRSDVDYARCGDMYGPTFCPATPNLQPPPPSPPCTFHPHHGGRVWWRGLDGAACTHTHITTTFFYCELVVGRTICQRCLPHSVTLFMSPIQMYASSFLHICGDDKTNGIYSAMLTSMWRIYVCNNTQPAYKRHCISICQILAIVIPYIL